MELLVAIGHFVGALVALVLLKISLDFFELWDKGQYGEQLRDELALKLGIRRDQVDLLEWDREVAKVLEQKFSEDRLGNRLADLCGIVALAWHWLGILVIALLFLSTALATFPDNLGMAVWAWSAIVAWALFSILARLFASLCNLFTGRYPGQPKKTRAALRTAALAIDKLTNR